MFETQRTVMERQPKADVARDERGWPLGHAGWVTDLCSPASFDDTLARLARRVGSTCEKKPSLDPGRTLWEFTDMSAMTDRPECLQIMATVFPRARA